MKVYQILREGLLEDVAVKCQPAFAKEHLKKVNILFVYRFPAPISVLSGHPCLLMTFILVDCQHRASKFWKA